MPGPKPQSRRTVILAVCFVAVIVALGAALALRVSGSEGVVLSGGSTYTEGVAGTSQRINPLFASANAVDQDLVQLVFAGLVRIAPDGRVIPGLAAEPRISDGGRTYTFQLRQGLRWQDGEPLTSRDVAFTIRQLTDPDFRGDPALAEPWLGVDVQAPDDRTIVIQLRQASGPFVARNATLGILPEHLLRDLSPEELYNAPFNSAPVGAGPYKLDRVDSREARLVANDTYYLGRPNISELTLRFFPDYSSAVRAMEAGDIGGLLVRDSVSEETMTALSDVKGASVEQLQRASQVLLYLNTDNVFFQDERVRRAVSLAIDRDGMVERAFAGAATASASPVAPGTWAYAREFDLTGPNIEEARNLLREAGWIAHPTTGILTKDGEEFRFTIRTDNDPVRVALAGEVARQLEPAGIRATVASTTFSVLRRDFLQERKYSAALAGWDQGSDPDPYFGWHSTQRGPAGLNLANFEDAVIDELIAKGRTENDLEVRKDAYRQFQEVWQDLAPSVVLAYPNYIYIRASNLEGESDRILFTAAQRFSDIHTWQQ